MSYSIEVWPGSVWKFGLVAKSRILTDLARMLEAIEFTTWPVSNLVIQVAQSCLLTITSDKAIRIALNHM